MEGSQSNPGVWYLIPESNGSEGNGYEFEQALEDGEGQGSLVCCCSGSHKELDMTEQLIMLAHFNSSW